MQKLITSCPNCHRKMKIQKKAAKYRCPHCASICKVSSFQIFFLIIENQTKAIQTKIKKKYQNLKNTYQYMKMLRKNKK